MKIFSYVIIGFLMFLVGFLLSSLVGIKSFDEQVIEKPSLPQVRFIPSACNEDPLGIGNISGLSYGEFENRVLQKAYEMYHLEQIPIDE